VPACWADHIISSGGPTIFGQRTPERRNNNNNDDDDDDDDRD
jgi:hypothetical protein